MRFELRHFGNGTGTPARDLTYLHLELFGPHSIFGMGKILAERFYYGCLPASGQLFGAAAYIDGSPIGFAAGTMDGAGLLDTGLRRHWAKLALALPAAMLREPATVPALWRQAREMRERPLPLGVGAAELLAIGVLPDYRAKRFKQRLGLSPSVELLRSVTDRFVSNGAARAVLNVDRGNLEAHRFFAREGWRPERIVPAGRQAPAQVEFSWSAAAREPSRSRLARERASLDKLIGITLADVGLGYPHTIEGFTEHSHDGLRGFVLKNPVR